MQPEVEYEVKIKIIGYIRRWDGDTTDPMYDWIASNGEQADGHFHSAIEAEEDFTERFA